MRDKIAINIADSFQSPFGKTSTLGDLVGNLVGAAIAIAGVTMFFILLFGGFKIISSAGSDDPQGAAQGKQAVTAAIIGFIIVVLAYLIVQAIEIVTGVRIISGA